MLKQTSVELKMELISKSRVFETGLAVIVLFLSGVTASCSSDLNSDSATSSSVESNSDLHYANAIDGDVSLIVNGDEKITSFEVTSVNPV